MAKTVRIPRSLGRAGFPTGDRPGPSHAFRDDESMESERSPSGSPVMLKPEGRNELSTFVRESTLTPGTFGVEDWEKVMGDASLAKHITEVFRTAPFIHEMQTCRFDARSLDALRAAIQLAP